MIWWIIGLLIAPLVYVCLRPEKDFDFAFDLIFMWATCWALALGLIIGKLL